MKNMNEKPKIKAVGCFLEYEGQFLILHRSVNMNQGGKWGLPAGGVEQGENERDAIAREVREEIGISIPCEEFSFLQKIIFNFPDKINEYSVYSVKLKSKIDVSLDPQEHQDYAWTTGKECYKRNDLMQGVHDVLERTGRAS